MASPLNVRYRSERVVKAGGRALAGWSPRDVAKLAAAAPPAREPVRSVYPTIEEMRRVARYMADVMGLHSAAGKLVAKANKLERLR